MEYIDIIHIKRRKTGVKQNFGDWEFRLKIKQQSLKKIKVKSIRQK